jgi:hypothetical protein
MDKNDFCTMRSIAELLENETSHTVGRTLMRKGLRRSDGDPSDQAKALGLVFLTEGPQSWIPLWLWHRDRTLVILEAEGMVRKDALTHV